MKRIALSLLLSACLIPLSGCTPVGMAAGAGAALGVSAASEEGISGTAQDLKIKALISDKWFKYDLATFAKLNLTVEQGRVLVTGIVQDPDARVEAVKLAWQVEGVTQVINEIRVAEGEGATGYVRDQWITTRLRTAMTFARDIKSINYSIDTVGGTVYLMGIAQDQAELNRVTELARTIPHVQQVVSYVKMRGETGNAQAAQPMTQPAPQNNTGAASSYDSYNSAPAPGDVQQQGGVNEWGEPISNPAPVESEPIRW